MSIKLDLSQFKHVKTDKHTTTLRHKDGHEITLAHTALSNDGQKQLSALSGISKAAQTSADANEVRDQKMADGGKVKADKPAGGTLDYSNFGKEFNAKASEYKRQEALQPRKKLAEGSGPLGNYADNSDLEAQAAQQTSDSASQGISAYQDQLRAQRGLPPIAESASPASKFNMVEDAKANNWQAPDNTASGTPPPGSVPMDDADRAPATEEASANERADDGPMGKSQPGTDMNGNPIGPDGKPIPVGDVASAAPAAAAQTPQPLPPQDYGQAVAQHLTQEDQAWANDLSNGHIQPKTYADLFANKDTLGKVGTIFGLLVSGMGAGVTGKPNAMLEMMNSEIQRDYEAQKQSKDNAINFHKLAMQNQVNQGTLAKMVQEGHLTEAQAGLTTAQGLINADALGLMQQNRATADYLAKEVQKYPPGSPQRAQAEQVLAYTVSAVDEKNKTLASQAAATSALLAQTAQGGGGGQGGDNTMMQSFGTPQMKELSKQQADKTIPGIPGVSPRPIEGADREKIANHQKLNSLFNEAQELSSKYGGLKGGFQAITDAPERAKVMARAKTLQSELISSVRTAEDQGVYKKSDADFLAGQLGGPLTGMLSAYNTVPKLKEMQSISQRDMGATLGKYGLKAPSASSDSSGGDSHQKAIDWAKSHPNDSRAKLILKLNGQ